MPVFAAALAMMVMLGSGIFDELILPSGGVPVRPFPDDAAPEPAVMKASLGKSGISDPVELVFTLHRVAKGETLSRIAYNYGLTPATLISVNALERPEDVYAGRFLTIPYRDGIRVSPQPGESAADTAVRLRTIPEMVQSIPESGDFFVSGGLADENLPSAFLRDVFLYPVSGRVITAYGPGMDPLTGISFESEGIDLSVEPGTAVTASRTGTVIRTGNHSSYGLYVIMSHPGGWRSFYGNLGRITVAPGDVLEGGWRIGTAGSSGSVRSPRLHFVLIRDGETVDPLDYLF